MDFNYYGFRLRSKDFDSKRYSDFEYWNEFGLGTYI